MRLPSILFLSALFLQSAPAYAIRCPQWPPGTERTMRVCGNASLNHKLNLSVLENCVWLWNSLLRSNAVLTPRLCSIPAIRLDPRPATCQPSISHPQTCGSAGLVCEPQAEPFDPIVDVHFGYPCLAGAAVVEYQRGDEAFHGWIYVDEYMAIESCLEGLVSYVGFSDSVSLLRALELIGDGQ